MSCDAKIWLDDETDDWHGGADDGTTATGTLEEVLFALGDIPYWYPRAYANDGIGLVGYSYPRRFALGGAS